MTARFKSGEPMTGTSQGKGSSGPVRIRTFFQPEFYQQAIAQRCEADDRIAPPKRQALTQD